MSQRHGLVRHCKPVPSQPDSGITAAVSLVPAVAFVFQDTRHKILAMSSSLSGKRIIITGASSGIGAATARLCAEAGMHVLLNARRDDRLEKIAAECRQKGVKAVTLDGDVADPRINRHLLDLAEKELEGFDVVFANAGYGLGKPMHTLTDEELRRIFEVNFFAGYDLLRDAANRLIDAKRAGHLLMTSSILAHFTFPGAGAYSATKAAQHHVCRAMNMELAKHKIHVSTVHPIGTRTEFFEVAGRLSGFAGGPPPGPKWLTQPPETVARAVLRCLKRPRPEAWTSFGARLLSAAMTVYPPLMDLVKRPEARR